MIHVKLTRQHLCVCPLSEVINKLWYQIAFNTNASHHECNSTMRDALVGSTAEASAMMQLLLLSTKT